MWLLGLHGWLLLQGRDWEVYSGLVQLVDTRVLPLLSSADSDVLSRMVPANLARLARGPRQPFLYGSGSAGGVNLR